jgi:hypothetical protein
MDTGIVLEGGMLSAIVIGITQIVKPAVPAKYIPLTSLIIAVALSVVWEVTQTGDYMSAVLRGLVAGLSANGLYDQAKAITA